MDLCQLLPGLLRLRRHALAEHRGQVVPGIPLSEEERAAVDDGQAALDQLADVPTPAGPTPREIGAPANATLLPILDVTTQTTDPGQCGMRR
ncbi:hypothetical protein [Streptomyces sp. NPDC058457]|uniref:hypothetical protein n=1 Tax=Streptomyces sp. NPDC058457 TaxID=3346507 RepID=UPI0036680B3E